MPIRGATATTLCADRTCEHSGGTWSIRTRWKSATAVARHGSAGTRCLRQRLEVDEHDGSAGPSPAAAPRTTAGAAAATTTAGARPPPRPRHRRRAARRPPPRRRGCAPGSHASASDIGLIDGVYKGTGGFEIDPKDCPSDWDPEAGHHRHRDQPVHQPADVRPARRLRPRSPTGVKAYFKYINDNGGIDGRKIILDIKDDGYQPDKTKTNVDEALGAEQVRRVRHGARHAEQPGDLGRDQRRVHAAAAQRHRRGAVGRRREPPVDHGHAARLLHRGQPVGEVAGDRAPGR